MRLLLSFLITVFSLTIYGQNIPQAEKNYTIQEVFDENGSVISYVQVYKDKLGRTQQVQSKDIENSDVLVQQVIYDQFGRPSIQTLPAPINSSSTASYITDFMKDASGGSFGIEDFDQIPYNESLGEIFNPKGVLQGSGVPEGTLGWYYSNDNDNEDYVPASSFPYTRTLQRNDLNGYTVASSLAGEYLKMGSGNIKKFFFMRNTKELEYISGIDGVVFKTINVDEDGLENITYSSPNGKVIAQCYSGLSLDGCVPQESTYKLCYEGNNFYGRSIEVHVPGNSNSSLTILRNLRHTDTIQYCSTKISPNPILFVLEDLLSGKKLVENTDFSINSTTGLVTFLGDYFNQSNYLRITLDYLPAYKNCMYNNHRKAHPLQTIIVKTDYSNWTFYEYTSKEQLDRIYTTKNVDCSSFVEGVEETKTYESFGTTPATIGTYGASCPIFNNSAEKVSTLFDNFDPLIHTGRYEFYFSFFANARDFPNCVVDPPGCDYVYPPQHKPKEFELPHDFNLSEIGGENELIYLLDGEGEMPSTPEEELNTGYDTENELSEYLAAEYKQTDFNYGLVYPDGQAIDYLEVYDEVPLNIQNLNDLFPTFDYSNSLGNGSMFPRQTDDDIGDSNGTNLTQEGYNKFLKDRLDDVDWGNAEEIALYCSVRARHCADRVINCGETGYDPDTDWNTGGACDPIIPCKNQPEKRRGTFKIIVQSLGLSRSSDTWTPISILNKATYDDFNRDWFNYRGPANQGEDDEFEYIVALNYTCECKYRLQILSGPVHLHGALDDTYLELYQKIKVKIKSAYYAPYHGSANQIYQTVNFSDAFQTLGREMGFSFGANYKQSEPRVMPVHNYSGKKSFTYYPNGLLKSETNPDEGTKKFYYDDNHRIKFIQTAQQAIDEKYSYFDYDQVGRISARGIVDYSGSTPPANLINNNVYEHPSYTTHENHLVSYDEKGSGFPTATPYNTYNQNFLKGKVTKTKNDYSTTWYGYDQSGRLSWTVQNINELGTTKYFTINYTYNVQGNISLMDYQKETASERFVHKYSYDANGRLVKVETSKDNSVFTENAEYSYYRHGLLKRVELGNDLQGIDYVYTINGRLKSINNPVLGSRDPGEDGEVGAHSNFAQDIFGMTIDYYRYDYLREGTGIQSYTEYAYQPMPPFGNLELVVPPSKYNGIVNSVRWRTRSEVNTVSTPEFEGKQLAYIPQYDPRNRIVSATFGEVDPLNEGLVNTGASVPPGTYDGPTVSTSDNYKVWNVDYDKDGNLTTLNRNGFQAQSLNMDQLNFSRSGNKLNRVIDAVVSDPYSDDISNQIATNNYSYDASGRMIADNEESNYLTYNSDDLPISIYSNPGKTTKKSSLSYDERGQRLVKELYTDGIAYPTTKQFYIRDINGNLLSIINKTYTSSTTVSSSEEENPIYGASQLGFYNRAGSGSYRYQIADYLGNIRATIGGTKVGGDVELLSMQDYYPFGSPMPGRSIISSSLFKQGYQGQEVDGETGFNAFELRLYDARIGSWLSPDPYKQHASPYMAMSNNPLSFIDPDGGWDCENPPCNEENDDGSYNNNDSYNILDIINQIIENGSDWFFGEYGSWMAGVARDIENGKYYLDEERQEYQDGYAFNVQTYKENPFYIESNISSYAIDRIVRSETDGNYGGDDSNTPGGKWDLFGKGTVPYKGKGIGNTNFVGKGPQGDPANSGLAPIDIIDYYAYIHDAEYFKARIEGGYMDARFNLDVAEADFRLVQGAILVVNAYRAGTKDPITGYKVSQRTSNIAKVVISFYMKQVNYKYQEKYGIVPPFHD